MGIQNLNLLLKRVCGDSIGMVDLSKFENSRIAIDTSLYLYKFKYTHNGKFLDGFVKQIIKFVKNSILPVYIFDGKPPNEKGDVINGRKEKRLELTDKITNLQDFYSKLLSGEELIDPEKHKVKDMDEDGNIVYRVCKLEDILDEIEQLNRTNITIYPEDVKDLKKLLYLMGIPYIEADGEAEVLCAKLNSRGYVSACLSEDNDFLVSGGKVLIKNFKFSNNTVMEYNLDSILCKMGISYDEFVDLCILSGCDYTKKIHGIGIINAYRYILKYKTIEKIIENISKDLIKDNDKEDFNYKKARELFKESFEDIEKYLPLLEIKNYNMPGLIEFLKGQICATTQNLVDKSFIKLRKKMDIIFKK